MGWFSRKNKSKKAKNSPVDINKEVWKKCPSCEEIIWLKNLIENDYTCPKCSYHFRLTFQEKLYFFCDESSFEELFQHITTKDPLGFKDRQPYKKRISKAKAKTGQETAFICGKATIEGKPVAIGFLNFEHLGGSLGSAEGEKISNIISFAIDNHLPLLIVSSSGGARMQESVHSLMQMAKTSAALDRLNRSGGVFISVLTNPTMAGVMASFASLGDVIVAEPKALIGFTGPRVIQQTIKQDLPEGFQSSEFLLEHGLIDMIVHRKDMKATLDKLLEYLKVRK